MYALKVKTGKDQDRIYCKSDIQGMGFSSTSPTVAQIEHLLEEWHCRKDCYIAILSVMGWVGAGFF